VSGHEPIRSYQRIFRPERRLHHIEGRTLPIPGGVPLRWLGYAGASLLVVLALGSGSVAVPVGAAAAAGVGGLTIRDRAAGLLAAAAALAGTWLVGQLLGALDWPLRFVVIPAALASALTQATPDGRRADRFALSWLLLRLSPRRRSLGRELPPVGTAQTSAARLWVAADEHGPEIRRARVRGEGVLVFAKPVGVRRAGLRQRRLQIREPRGRRRRRELRSTRVAIGAGEVAEVRR
jgi:hypothetical protein